MIVMITGNVAASQSLVIAEAKITTAMPKINQGPLYMGLKTQTTTTATKSMKMAHGTEVRMLSPSKSNRP